MIKLILNELSKIFHKKFIYIILAISLLFVILTNFIYTKFDSNNNYYTDKINIQTLIEENKKNPMISADDISWFISNQTTIDQYNLKSKYKDNSWQREIIASRAYRLIYDLNNYKYNNNKEEYQKSLIAYDEFIKKLDNNDWKSFANADLVAAKLDLSNLEESLKIAKGELEKTPLENQISVKKVEIEALNLRLSKNIIYANDYLNTALNNYVSFKTQLNDLNIKDKTYKERVAYNSALEGSEKALYVINNKQDIDTKVAARSLYLNFFSEYELLIVVIVVVIAGVIVSEEFNKGTIKLLLIKPYKRWQILLSKYITTLIMILFTIFSLFVFQTIVGIIFMGTESLSIPAVFYDFNNMKLITMNIFKYFSILCLAELPIIILLMTLSFALGTLFGHSSVALAVTFIGYVGSEVINMLVIGANIKWMRYFVSLNWNFKETLFGNLPQFQYINFNFSAIICLIYLAIMLFVTFLIFKRKNIKNI